MRSLVYIMFLLLTQNFRLFSQDIFPVVKNELAISRVQVESKFINCLKDSPFKSGLFTIEFKEGDNLEQIVLRLNQLIFGLDFIFPEGYEKDKNYMPYSFVFYNNFANKIPKSIDCSDTLQCIFFINLIVRNDYYIYINEDIKTFRLLVVPKNIFKFNLNRFFKELKYLKIEEVFSAVLDTQNEKEILTEIEQAKTEYSYKRSLFDISQHILCSQLLLMQNENGSWNFNIDGKSSIELEILCTAYCLKALIQTNSSFQNPMITRGFEWLFLQIPEHGSVCNSNFINAILLEVLLESKKYQFNEKTKITNLINRIILEQQENGGFYVSNKRKKGGKINMPVTYFCVNSLMKCIQLDIEAVPSKRALTKVENLLKSTLYTKDDSPKSNGFGWLNLPEDNNKEYFKGDLTHLFSMNCYYIFNQDDSNFWNKAALEHQLNSESELWKSFDLLYLSQLDTMMRKLKGENKIEFINNLCNKKVSMVNNMINEQGFIKDPKLNSSQYSLLIDSALTILFLNLCEKNKDSSLEGSLNSKANPDFNEYLKGNIKKLKVEKEFEENNKKFDSEIQFVDEEGVPFKNKKFSYSLSLDYFGFKNKGELLVETSDTPEFVTDSNGVAILKNMSKCKMNFWLNEEPYYIEDLNIFINKEKQKVIVKKLKIFKVQFTSEETINYKILSRHGNSDFSNVGYVKEEKSILSFQLDKKYYSKEPIQFKIIVPGYGEGISKYVDYDNYDDEIIKIDVLKKEIVKVFLQYKGQPYQGEGRIIVMAGVNLFSNQIENQDYDLKNYPIEFFKPVSKKAYIRTYIKGFADIKQEFDLTNTNDINLPLSKGCVVRIKKPNNLKHPEFDIVLTRKCLESISDWPGDQFYSPFNENEFLEFNLLPEGEYKLNYLLNNNNGIQVYTCALESGIENFKIKNGETKVLNFIEPKLYSVTFVPKINNLKIPKQNFHINYAILEDEHQQRIIPSLINEKNDNEILAYKKGRYYVTIYYYLEFKSISKRFLIELNDKPLIKEFNILEEESNNSELKTIDLRCEDNELASGGIYFFNESKLNNLRSYSELASLSVQTVSSIVGRAEFEIPRSRVFDLAVLPENRSYLPLYFSNISLKEMLNTKYIFNKGHQKIIKIKYLNGPCMGAYFSLVDKETNLAVLNDNNYTDCSNKNGEICLIYDLNRNYDLYIQYLGTARKTITFNSSNIPDEIILSKSANFSFDYLDKIDFLHRYELLDINKKPLFILHHKINNYKNQGLGCSSNLIIDKTLYFEDLQPGTYYVEIQNVVNKEKKVYGPFEAK